MSQFQGARDSYTEDDQRIDLLALVRTARDGWRLVLCCTAVTLIFGLIFLHIATYKYTAVLTVTPAQSNESDRGASGLGNLSGLASLAGVSLPSSGSGTQFSLYLEGMQSRYVADELAKNQALMSVIFNGEWDPQKRQFHQPYSVLSRFKPFVYGIIGEPVTPWVPPNGARLQQYLEANIAVVQDTKKPFLATISFDNADPKFAAEFLSALHTAADENLRQMTLTRTTQYIAYLSRQVEATQVAEVRQALMQTLSEQEKFEMMANSTAPFAAQPLGAPAVSLLPTNPQPLRVLGIALVLGLFIGTLAVFVVDWLGLTLRQTRRALWLRRLAFGLNEV